MGDINTMNIECNYLVHEREDYIRKINVYKLGKSGDVFSRMSGYPKGSKLVFMSSSSHMLLVENELIKIFSNIFIQRTDRGREYFEGNLETMKKIMAEIIAHFNNTIPVVDNNSIKYEITQEKRDAGLIIQKYAKNYLISKKNKKIFLMTKNFIKDSRIVKNNQSFLKVKDVRLLWNTKNNTNLTQGEISCLLSPVFGNITVINGFLVWENRTIGIGQYKDNILHQGEDETSQNKVIDDWSFYRLQYIIEDEKSYIQHTDLKKNFNLWHYETFSNYAANEDIKKYFTEHLNGFYRTKRSNINIYGYVGFKLIHFIKKKT